VALVGLAPGGEGERVIFDFQDPRGARQWEAVNDDVMGGVSEGGARATDTGMLEFSGTVSLENNGGFASIRSRAAPIDLSGYAGLLIRVRGDGKRYAFTLRTDVRIVAGAYRLKFATRADEWQEIYLPFSEFEPTSFGQRRPDLPPLNPGRIRSFGFTISDKQAGPFRLGVKWIKAVAAPGHPGLRADSATRASRVVAMRHWIEAAIARGAPLFNAGETELCTGIYALTARSLVCLKPEGLPPVAVERLAAALEDVKQASESREQAWILRRALDFALQALVQAEPADGVSAEASQPQP
jgi:monofunctional biosynthetic peptidoglycan transglycosylase